MDLVFIAHIHQCFKGTWPRTMMQIQHTQDVFLLSGFSYLKTGDWAKQSQEADYQLNKATQGFSI